MLAYISSYIQELNVPAWLQRDAIAAAIEQVLLYWCPILYCPGTTRTKKKKEEKCLGKKKKKKVYLEKKEKKVYVYGMLTQRGSRQGTDYFNADMQVLQDAACPPSVNRMLPIRTC